MSLLPVASSSFLLGMGDRALIFEEPHLRACFVGGGIVSFKYNEQSSWTVFPDLPS
jgi:hypothetical protein